MSATASLLLVLGSVSWATGARVARQCAGVLVEFKTLVPGPAPPIIGNAGGPLLPSATLAPPEESPHCDPQVIDAFKKAWEMAGYGTQEYEAGFRIDRIEDRLEIVFAPMTRERMKLTIPILRGVTIAIAHTHPNAADPGPGPKDHESPVRNYIISRWALNMTLPGTRPHRRVRGSDWGKPCP